MTKHILDRPQSTAKPAIAPSLDVARKQLPHRETLALQRRSRLRSDSHRQAQFLRCARDAVDAV